MMWRSKLSLFLWIIVAFGVSGLAARASGPISIKVIGAANPGEMSVTWTDGSPDADGYKIERKRHWNDLWEVVGVVPGNAQGFADAGLLDGVSYWYQVRAISNLAGDSTASLAQMGWTLPKAPSAVVAEAVAADQVNLRWKDNSSAKDWFEIWRGTADGNGIVLIGLSTIADYTDLTTSPRTSYTYKIRAHVEPDINSLWTTVTVRTPK
jgi:hypothetical protein